MMVDKRHPQAKRPGRTGRGSAVRSAGTRVLGVLIPVCGALCSLRTRVCDHAAVGACASRGLDSRFLVLGEVAVGEPPVVLVRGQLPGLVGSDRLRDPFMELWEGMRS